MALVLADTNFLPNQDNNTMNLRIKQTKDLLRDDHYILRDAIYPSNLDGANKQIISNFLSIIVITTTFFCFHYFSLPNVLIQSSRTLNVLPKLIAFIIQIQSRTYPCSPAELARAVPTIGVGTYAGNPSTLPGRYSSVGKSSVGESSVGKSSVGGSSFFRSSVGGVISRMMGSYTLQKEKCSKSVACHQSFASTTGHIVFLHSGIRQKKTFNSVRLSGCENLARLQIPMYVHMANNNMHTKHTYKLRLS